MSDYLSQLGSGRSFPFGLDSGGLAVPDSAGSARFPLSTSTNGEPVAVGTTLTNGTVIHVGNTRAQDEVYLWATNTGSSSTVLYVSFNEANISTGTKKFAVSLNANNGLTLVCPGLPIKNATIYAGAGASGVNLFGFVMRYYPRVSGQSDPSTESGFDGAQ